jgi:hypothetical protein
MLGVLASTRPVVDAARDVRIDQDAVERMAARLAGQGVEAPEWRVWPHWWDDAPNAADYVLVLDALNFCFWGEPRWRVHYGGKLLDGYWALAACLRRALEAGTPILDPGYLASFDEAAARDLFAGDAEIPLLPQRIANLREIGNGLLALAASPPQPQSTSVLGSPPPRTGDDVGAQPRNYRPADDIAADSRAAQRLGVGDSPSFSSIVAACNGSGEALVAEVIRRFPSFDDTATYDGRPVKLYKRAQILVSDLHGIYEGQGLGQFTDLDRLTAFADYKIPQVLREAGILVYSGALAATVDRQEIIPPGDPREVEIRAATIWGCELLRQALSARRSGPLMRTFEVDWLLWSDAQGRTISTPYHRTRTIFY